MSSSITYYKDQITIDTFFPFGKDIGYVEGFATALKAYTSAGIDEISYTVGKQLNLDQDTKDTYPLYMYAKILLRRAYDGKLYGLLLYAPLKSMFNSIEGPQGGFKVKQDIGNQLAGFYSTFAGEAFEFYKGWLTGETSIS